jgi:hypothetical protein
MLIDWHVSLWHTNFLTDDVLLIATSAPWPRVNLGACSSLHAMAAVSGYQSYTMHEQTHSHSHCTLSSCFGWHLSSCFRLLTGYGMQDLQNFHPIALNLLSR